MAEEKCVQNGEENEEDFFKNEQGQKIFRKCWEPEEDKPR